MNAMIHAANPGRRHATYNESTASEGQRIREAPTSRYSESPVINKVKVEVATAVASMRG